MLVSRIPQLAATLDARVGLGLAEAAERIALAAKQRVPDRPPIGEGLIEAIHVERDNPLEYQVVAGNEEVFYGHMVEHGTTHSAPRPFLVPATEEQREVVGALVRAALKEWA